MDGASLAIDRAIDGALEKLGAYAPSVGDRIYHWVDAEAVEWTDGRGWTDGFWPGLLWLAHEATGDPTWAKLAGRSRHRFKERLAVHETHTHDMGFLYTLSAVAPYSIASDPEDRDMALAAARSLAARFNPFGLFIRAWNDRPEDTESSRAPRRGKAIIDTMMNLHLLWWASRESGNEMFAEIAHSHARTTRRHFFRDDGSLYHTFDFHPSTGKPLGGRTHQGYSDESCWSRGQAWALYGYALAYSWTRSQEYLEAATVLADYWLKHCPEHGIPPWDFDAPDDRSPDTSAAAIAVCGLQELARYVDAPQGATYRDLAVRALTSLAAGFLQPERYMGLLSGGVSNMPAGSGVGVSLVYGDYFCLEGFLRAKGRTSSYWYP